MRSMRIAFFGSSLVSAYWNGAATYYRGILRALNRQGHRITFYEPDAFERQQHRDISDPDYARVIVYPADEDGVRSALRHAEGADLVVKASGVGVFDSLLEEAVLDLREKGAMVAFWDVDAPATLDRVSEDRGDPFRMLIPEYDVIFTYGGGEPVRKAYLGLGARICVPVYNAVDADTHYPVQPCTRFGSDLSFLGNRMPDREERVREFFFRAAELLPAERFLLGGSGWGEGVSLPGNVRYVGHVYTGDHNEFNCSARAVLNISRESMARYGFSPATRVFEAAGAGACIITDKWEGIDSFFTPGAECLVAEDGRGVARILSMLETDDARILGAAARERVLDEHTYTHRASLVESVIMEQEYSEVRT